MTHKLMTLVVSLRWPLAHRELRSNRSLERLQEDPNMEAAAAMVVVVGDVPPPFVGEL